MNKKLQFKEINGLTFFRKPYTDTWVISGIDICKELGYKNPYEQAKQIYKRFKEYFTKSSYILNLDRTVVRATGGDLTPTASHERSIPTRCYTRPGLIPFKRS